MRLAAQAASCSEVKLLERADLACVIRHVPPMQDLAGTGTLQQPSLAKPTHRMQLIK
jgi:hypothetical protein